VKDDNTPLFLFFDGTEMLVRSDYSTFFAAVKRLLFSLIGSLLSSYLLSRFAKLPYFITEPPGIATLFTHDVGYAYHFWNFFKEYF
jgi:hypothetical protein